MCGIVGIFQRSGSPIAPTLLRHMSDAIQHRGPDDEGVFCNGPIGLAHQRLSIIDLSRAGRQPMSDESSRVWITYNGEVYNFLEIRSELERLGYHFRSHTDTEVILNAYIEWGRESFGRLRGMFAFGIYDVRTQELILVRDPLGIKPLYFAELGTEIVFASEIKAILKHPLASHEINPTAFAQYLKYLYVPEPLSIYKNIQRLPAGCCLTVSLKGSPLQDRYYKLPEVENEAIHMGIDEYAKKVYTNLSESVSAHMVADVPVGAFLSGGIDSSAIVAFMRQKTKAELHTFTIGFEGGGWSYDERMFAREIANFVDSQHHEIVVNPKLTTLLDRVLDAFDEPFGNPAALIAYSLSEYASKYTKVVMSGVGADELFGGYPRYKAIQWLQNFRWLPTAFKKQMANLANKLLSSSPRRSSFTNRLNRFITATTLPNTHIYDYLAGFAPDSLLFDLIHSDLRNEVNLIDPHKIFAGHANFTANWAMYADIQSYLPGDLLTYTDRCAMHHGLEVRVPFCDLQVVKLAQSIPLSYKLKGSNGKYVLRKAFEELLPKNILHRDKRGFSVPMGEWLKIPLHDSIDEYRELLFRSGFIDKRALNYLFSAYHNGSDDLAYLIWALIVFAVWSNKK